MRDYFAFRHTPRYMPPFRFDYAATPPPLPCAAAATPLLLMPLRFSLLILTASPLPFRCRLRHRCFFAVVTICVSFTPPPRYDACCTHAVRCSLAADAAAALQMPMPRCLSRRHADAAMLLLIRHRFAALLHIIEMLCRMPHCCRHAMMLATLFRRQPILFRYAMPC